MLRKNLFILYQPNSITKEMTHTAAAEAVITNVAKANKNVEYSENVKI